MMYLFMGRPTYKTMNVTARAPAWARLLADNKRSNCRTMAPDVQYTVTMVSVSPVQKIGVRSLA